MVQSLRWFLGKPFSLEEATAQDLWAFFAAQGFANLVSVPAAIAITRFRLGARFLAALGRIWNVLASAERDDSAKLLHDRPSPATPHDWGLGMRHLASDVALGCVAFCMLAPPVLALQAVLTQWFPYEHLLIVSLREHMTTSLFVVGFFVAVVVAPLFEEFFFRVLLQGWLERFGVNRNQSPTGGGESLYNPLQGTPAALIVTAELVNQDAVNPYTAPHSIAATAEAAQADPVKEIDVHPPRWPIFISALIFALMHAGNGPDPIPLFFLAIGLGYLYRQTHRITPSMTVHFLLNGASMTILWLELTYGGPPRP
jgi:membrane protease YdiL (CAAX protease family)